MDIERARFNMVEQQIRPWDVLDTKVLELLLKVRREDFVPASHRALAFADLEIPIGHGEKMLPPKIEARMLQELAVQPEDRILEVGTGSGYTTALLASQGAHVYSVDIVSEFTHAAAARLEHRKNCFAGHLRCRPDRRRQLCLQGSTPRHSTDDAHTLSLRRTLRT